jgi:hypothetical protein
VERVAVYNRPTKVFSIGPRALRPIGLTLFAAVVFCTHIDAQAPTPSGFSLPTQDRVQTSGWWPTKGTANVTDFVGTSECAKCHEKEAIAQRGTSMAQAAAPAATSEILEAHSHLSAQRGPYNYELLDDGTAVKFSVTDGTNSLSATVAWAFGLGHKGQTYIYERDGDFYESRLSFYKTLQRLDLTTGHTGSGPEDLKIAMGRWLDPVEARRCFGCHTTGSTTASQFDTSHATPGVTCEACHGPGASHVAAMKRGEIDAGRRAILNPRRLNPVDSVDFCGACHRTWADVILEGMTGVMNVRFQPYRLEDSKCWRRGDARLTCIACHNPHEPLVLDTAAYDQKCLACHKTIAEQKTVAADKAQASHPGARCPIATRNCASCHMPQVEVPSVHAPFVDHRIRIFRGN